MCPFFVEIKFECEAFTMISVLLLLIELEPTIKRAYYHICTVNIIHQICHGGIISVDKYNLHPKRELAKPTNNI